MRPKREDRKKAYLPPFSSLKPPQEATRLRPMLELPPRPGLRWGGTRPVAKGLYHPTLAESRVGAPEKPLDRRHLGGTWGTKHGNRVFALLLFLFYLPLSLAQTLLPAATFGLSFRDEAGVWVYEGAGMRLTYVPGVGWADPVDPSLPPPEGERIPLEVLRSLGYFRTPEAGVRSAPQGRGFRLVLDLTQPHPGLPQASQERERLTLLLPYLALGTLRIPWPKGVEASVRLLPTGTELRLLAKGKLLAYRLFPLQDPPRLVLDLFPLEPEVEEPLAPGIRYREIWTFTPEPVRLFLVEAEKGRLVPVGRPGVRALPKDLAKDALAVLNGGYFDPKSATPIGLWVQDGVTVSYPFGRVALMWDNFTFFLGFPQFEAVVKGPNGEQVRVGINAS
ncbi:MAG: hypothetical protein P3W93_003175, partial [Thermus sp.]|nr:hypothetical protein [Thermus sp.]